MSFWDIMSALGAIAIIVGVLVLTYYASRWYARRMGGSGVGKYVTVHDRVAMGSAASVAIVEVSGRFYLLGVSEKNIQFLCELEDFDPHIPEQASSKVPFGQMFSDMLDKTRKNRNKGDDGGGQ